VDDCERSEFPQIRHDFSDTKIYWRKTGEGVVKAGENSEKKVLGSAVAENIDEKSVKDNTVKEDGISPKPTEEAIVESKPVETISAGEGIAETTKIEN